jgi:polyphosphate glucokinase
MQYNPPVSAKKSNGAKVAKVNTLCVDIGGTGLKMMVVSHKGDPVTERARVETPHPATPKAVLEALDTLLPSQEPGDFMRVSCGFPGVVVSNEIHTAPNLDESWAGFKLGTALTKLTGKPARVLNDAGVQGHGVIEGKGVEMCITLGTGFGCSLFVDGRYVPNLELAHHPFRKAKTYEEYVGAKALDKVGKKKWNKRVEKVIEQLAPIWNYRVLYIGGGNSKKLKIDLPDNVKIVENLAGLLGGVKLWERDF